MIGALIGADFRYGSRADHRSTQEKLDGPYNEEAHKRVAREAEIKRQRKAAKKAKHSHPPLQK